MDLAVRRLLSLLVFFFHVSLLFSTTECGRTLQGQFSSQVLLGDGWSLVTEPDTVTESNEPDTVSVNLAGTSIDVTEFDIENEAAEPPMEGGMGENEESNPSMEMDFAPRSIPSVSPPVASQPQNFQTPLRKTARSPISQSQLGPLAIGMLIIAAIAVGLMLGAIGGLFFLRLMRDNK